MASTQTRRPTRGDRVDGAARWLRWPWALVPILLAGLLLGGVGALLGLARGEWATAQATIQVEPDADALQSLTSGSTGSSTSPSVYVSGQVGLLTGDAFTDRVAAASGLPRRAVDATQVGTSTLVDVSVSDPVVDDALARLTAAIETYRSERQAAATESIGRDLESVRALVSATDAASSQAQFLRQQEAQLSLALDRVPSLVPVVSPPAIVPGSGLPAPLLYAALGFFGGAALTAAVLLALASLASLRPLRTPAQAEGEGVRVLFPVLSSEDPHLIATAAPIRAALKDVPASGVVVVGVGGSSAADCVRFALAGGPDPVAAEVASPDEAGVARVQRGGRTTVLAVMLQLATRGALDRALLDVGRHGHGPVHVVCVTPPASR